MCLDFGLRVCLGEPPQMSTSITIRPPIGFIVEGMGEYNSYPSLFSRIVNNDHLYIPRINSGGYGGITSNLKEHLSDITLAYHPYTLFITLDLIDVIKANLFNDCSALFDHLILQKNDWLLNAKHDNRMAPLPEYIQIVIQIQKFETWMISDVTGLIDAGFISPSVSSIKDVDNFITDPCSWLEDNSTQPLNTKNPAVAKTIISSIDPNVMKDNSLSFNKFYREVQKYYALWEQACQNS